MKIISWNINGIRAITGQNPSKRLDEISRENKLFNYTAEQNPDILCVQETKASIDQISEEFRCPPGYEDYYFSSTAKKGYSGVAIFTKIKPKQIIYGIGIEKFDVEGRVIQAEFDDFTLMNIYFPKGYTDDPRLDYKLEFYDELIKYAEKLMKEGRQLIISGDYNTAHTAIDLARPKENTNTSGFLEIERVKLDKMNEIGLFDSYRQFVKEGGNYTWWSHRGGAREKNVGWRIDYHFVSEGLVSSLKSAEQHPLVLGSDHCPVIVELK